MDDTRASQTSQDRPNAGAVQPSAIAGRPYITNPVGWDFVTSEIAERNPIVRHALTRRAQGLTE